MGHRIALRPRSLPPPAKSQPFDMDREIRASDLGKSARLVLLTIADHARHGRSKCTASTQTIARESNVSERTVRNALPVLEAKGWIQIERATGSRQSRHTIWMAPRGDSPPFVRLHEVGNSGPCSRQFQPGKGPVHPYRGIEGALEGVAARVSPIAQNNNPPQPPPPPDDDPEETARVIAAMQIRFPFGWGGGT